MNRLRVFLNVWRTVYQRSTSGVLLLAILLSNLGFLLTPFHESMAAQVTLDNLISTASTEHTILGSASVWVTDQVGYKFYVDNPGTCVYSKTTNGGTSWGTAVVVNSINTCFGIVVWYDRWTPGDAGNNIHILSAESGTDDLWYNRLDTTTDTRLGNATGVSTVTGSGQGVGATIAASANAGSITKGTDGTIYMAMNDDTDSYVVECSSNCGVASSWTETGANPMDNINEFSLVLPLLGGDILLINRDLSADDLRSKVWNNAGGTWSGTWTTIDANALENAGYDPAFAASVDTNTGNIYLAYVDWATTGAIGGTNDDVKTARYASGAWTLRTDVITNTTRGLTGVAIGIDANTSDVYVGYTGRTTTIATGNVYWKRSTDDMASWGAETGPVNSTADDIYGVDINSIDYQRLTISWYGAATDFMYIEQAMADLVPVTQVSSIGIQKTEARASTSDFYVGGTIVIDENVANRDVTSITITENGTTNAATTLDNIELRYDLDTSAPYDCASESYAGGESQFGTTDTDGFSAADGISTFTGTVGITTTQTMCVYPVMDITKSAVAGNSIEIEVANPGADILLSGGATAIPNHEIALTGTTLLKLDTDFRVQRGVSTISGDTLTITAGVDYEAPSSASSAFIRITNSGDTGAGRDNGGGTSIADDTMVRIINPENITTSITFQRGAASLNNTRVSWEIIEYKGVPGGENEIIVRRQEDLSYVSGSATLNTSAVSGITDDTDVAVFITSQYLESTAATVYNRGFSTAAWNAGSDTATFTRGATGNVAILSYAVVEFTGSNWKVQRAQHTYSAVGTTQTQAITAVNSLNRTFLHVQKRFSVSTHANFGQEVWLSGIGQVSFLLSAAATTPAGQTAVAWVIENTQTGGSPMDVTRSSGSFNTTGSAPQTNNVSIGATLEDLSVASIFFNNRSDTALNTWPEPILGVRLISTTQYEVWRSDIAANINYRTEVVEWPTAERKLRQNYYRLYVDNNALTPSDPWPAGGPNLGENTEMTAQDEALALGEQLRIRMSVSVEGSAQPAGVDSYKLQFSPRVTTCTAVTNWSDIGDAASTTAHWRGVNNTPADGTALSTDPPTIGDLKLSVSTVAGTYEEGNNSAVNPYIAFPNDEVEYDWIIEHNGANDKTSYCFRMIEADGTVFDGYDFYPTIRTVGYEPLITNWRWYDDETNATPTTSLGGENVSPSNIANLNALKLRLVLKESSGADGVDVKFALQYSQFADFSQGVTTLTSTTSCGGSSQWCYFDGAGVDNQIISSSVISDADSCIAGVGAGCGTYNEGISTTTATHDQTALTSTEYEFTLVQSGAAANRVFYFRLYNLAYDEVVNTAPTFSYPSLVTEGANLNFNVTGINSQTLIAGVTTDATTTPNSIIFGSIPFNTDYEAAQRITITTNAFEGYQVLKYASQQLLNSYGDPIPPVTSSNTTPAGWNTGCLVAATGCFGYHTTDATLDSGSGRFAPTDSYAALDTTPREIMYSSIPSTDIHDIVYRVKINGEQPAGDYTTSITYIAVPVH
jgi:hypothetical protein